MDNLKLLKALMKSLKLDFFLILSEDEHQNEYLIDDFKYREFITGFKGSYGDALITQANSYLWADGRYFTQAKKELYEGFQLKKIGFDESLFDFLKKNIANKTLGVLQKCVSINKSYILKEIAQNNNGKIKFLKKDLVKSLKSFKKKDEKINKIQIHKEEFSGQDIVLKINFIRNFLKSKNIKAFIFNKLDEIAWILNIRGSDILYNPLVISYLIVHENYVSFFVNKKKIDDFNYFLKNNIIVFDYDEFENKAKAITDKVALDKHSAVFWQVNFFKKNQISLIESPVLLAKAIKNKTEIQNAIFIHKQDALALLYFNYWLFNNIDKKISEQDASDKLLDFREKYHNFEGASFASISAFKENSAIIHYSPLKGFDKIIDKSSIYLIDSGGQYKEGTTDITRVFHFGDPTFEQKKYYTLVLKGHLNLKRAVFPKGTCGIQLDVLARSFLWQNHLNYNHGTSHGVGSFLCVHEGPQRISPQGSLTPLLENMILSNEPGVYFENKYGIRIENLVKVVKSCDDNYLAFEDLSIFPYAKNLILKEMLSVEDLEDINKYYQKIFKDLMPLIKDPKVADFLKKELDF